ncbi:hypothetical protein M422DRAFT_44456 [Sphaerobolus stellatus SS14]|nr:hypothetical protein M422DRAFT_44456 [Sphaerobolus stellatus SS14]
MEKESANRREWNGLKRLIVAEQVELRSGLLKGAQLKGIRPRDLTEDAAKEGVKYDKENGKLHHLMFNFPAGLLCVVQAVVVPPMPAFSTMSAAPSQTSYDFGDLTAYTQD